MNQADGSKFCDKICHIFGEKVVKECKRYTTLYSFQPLVANAYKKIFDFCQSRVNIDRLWLLYEYCKEQAQKLCTQKCPLRVVEDCTHYVDEKILDNDKAPLKSYDTTKEANETTYFTVIIKRKVIDFCKSSKNYSKVVEKFDFTRIIDEVVSTEEKVIKEDIVAKLTTIAQQLTLAKKLSRNERMVIKLMLENYEYSEMATLLGIETKELYRIKDRAIGKIAKAWKGGDENE
jgi:RNA polymerase sigma factor (sigma-70 family)